MPIVPTYSLTMKTSTEEVSFSENREDADPLSCT